MRDQYDIIVVGMGLVGSSLLAALKNSGLKIACLEHKPYDFNKPLNLESRPISLSYGSYKILNTLGLWATLEVDSTPIESVHISTKGSFGRLQFNADEEQIPALGYVVPFAVLERTLNKSAIDTGVELIPITEILDLKTDDSGTEITIKADGKTDSLKATLLVAADGAHSQVRELLKISVKKDNHHEIALTGKIILKDPHQQIAYERFSKQGTLAILPLKNSKECAVVWSMPERQWDLQEKWEDGQYLEELQSLIGYRLGKIEKFKRMAHYPLVSLVADSQIQESAILIGNAAHSLYPLAAQGFNLGLRDAATLAELIVEASQKKQSINDSDFLKKYETLRRDDQNSIINLTEKLHSAFNLRVPGLNGIRGLVMFSVDVLPPLKRPLAKRCLGISGRLSKLLRGIPLK